jgi:methylenetetrahydrofolate dehydrogenase (NADP+)/methenyltetrahydrofolate cyclohydrolase
MLILLSPLWGSNYLKADMVKDGVVVIDVGITRVPDDSNLRVM